MANLKAQQAFLRKRAAANRELQRGCDCMGNQHCPRTDNPCTGFARDCICDKDMSFMPWRKNAKPVQDEA